VREPFLDARTCAPLGRTAPRRPGAALAWGLLRSASEQGGSPTRHRYGCVPHGGCGGRARGGQDMDHYIPKRRVRIRFWCADQGAAEGQIFLDLDPSGSRHQTILTQLNSQSRFLPVATGTEGRIELVNRVRLLRLVPGPDVLQSDVFT